MLQGLMNQGVREVRAVCPIIFPSFPRSRTLWVGATRREISPALTIVAPAFINFGAVRVLTQIASVMVSLLKLALQYGRPQAIVTYNLNPGYVVAGYLIAKLWRIPLAPVAADLNPPDVARGGLRGLDARLQAALLRRADGVITFSSSTQRDFGLKQPSIKIEPGVDPAEFLMLAKQDVRNDGPKKILVFSGTLIEASGVLWLIEAFRLIPDQDLELWITGRGPLQTRIEQAVREDTRIRYLGFVSRSELLRLYRCATALINPRPVWLPEHQYNFPSKLIQYMATGRPVITTATGDVGEYEQFVFLVQRNDPEALAESIVKVCSTDEAVREGLGCRAREYVLQHKTWEVETRRVYEFLTDLASKQ